MEEEKVERERKRGKREGSVKGGKKIVEGETSVRKFLRRKIENGGGIGE